MLAFDSDLAPIVGQQVTLTEGNAASAGPRIPLLRARAEQPFTSQILGPTAAECDLVAHATVHGVPSGWLFLPTSGTYQPDDGGAPVGDSALRAVARVPGQRSRSPACRRASGVRMALDRDGDGIYNRRDRCPADPGC